jgi:RimJ/RimL family protein N-acetyltransferase
MKFGNFDIEIRLARSKDAAGIVTHWNENFKRGFSKYTGTNRSRNKIDARQLSKSLALKKKNDFVFIAIDRKAKKVIGTSNFSARDKGRTRHRGGMGWEINYRYARLGIGTALVKAILEEAKRRGFKKAQAEVAVENTASLKLAKNCGFRIEGRRKIGMLLDDGRYVDTYTFGKVLK